MDSIALTRVCAVGLAENRRAKKRYDSGGQQNCIVSTKLIGTVLLSTTHFVQISTKVQFVRVRVLDDNCEQIRPND